MNCGNCHQEYDENLSACPYCGAPRQQEGPPPVQEGTYQPQPQQPQAEQQPYQQPQTEQPPYQQPPQPEQQPYQQQPNYQQQQVPPQQAQTYQQAPGQQPQQPYQQPPSYQQYTQAEDPKAKNLALGSMVCGIVGLILCWVPFVGLILNILAVVFYTMSRKYSVGQQNGMATAGLVCGIIGLIVSAIVTILAIVALAVAGSLISAAASYPYYWY